MKDNNFDISHNNIETSSYSGFLYNIKHNGNGYRCGYIRIPPSHPWHNKDYNDIPADVHGGLTYTNVDAEGNYWIGFDCAHLYDLQDKSLPYKYPYTREEPMGTIKTLEYVRQQCHNLCEQATKALMEV
jgi:hypothetical protein